MTIYILLVAIIMILLILNGTIKTNINFLQLIVLALLTFFVGFRFETGYDWAMYRNFYEYDTFHSDIEFGYVFFIELLRFFFDGYQSLFFFTALVTYMCLYLGIKKYTKHTGIALVLFLLIPGFFLNTLTIIRQELAIVITFYAFSFLIDKKYYKYFLLMLLAFSIHYSVAIVLFTHFFVWKFALKIKYYYYYFLILFSLIFLKLNIGEFVYFFAEGGRYEFYQAGDSVSILKIVILNSLALLYIYFAKGIIDKSKYNIYIIFLFVMNIVFLNVFSSVIALSRIAYDFKIFEIVLVAQILFVFDKKFRVLGLIFIVIFYSILFLGALKVDMAETRTENNLIPYKNFFFK